MTGKHCAPRRRRLIRPAALLALLTLLSTLLPPSSAPAATSTAVTAAKTVTRSFLDDGTTKIVDSRRVSITVSQTHNLRSLQQIQVTWTGAHPTGGITLDPNSDFAQNEEYPFVLLECRGVDSATAPVHQQLTPQTCWTQYADERFVYGYDGIPAWRSDLYAEPKDRAAIVGAPPQASSAECTQTLYGTTYQRWLPFDSADGTSYGGGPFGCAGQAPEASPANLSSLALPSNETFGVTATDGTGTANFNVFTGQDHASLGCSQTVPCALVAVPVEGISCDPAGTLSQGQSVQTGTELDAARIDCESSGNFQPGQLLSSGFGSGAPAVDGTLWWSASNWRNRITVPLSFAPSDNACSLSSALQPRDVYGSELLTQATTQWSPYFCVTKKLFDFQHIQSPEPQARNLLSDGNIEAAFSSDVPADGYPRPTVNAPVAVTGFGIAFDIDDKKHNQVSSLKLTPRLLAKLLTESYPDQTFVKDPYPTSKDGTATLSQNPVNISQDPEFQALNPGLPNAGIDSAATLLALNTDSDVIHALTSYINADPVARHWLDGEPDPWGMRVNPNYRNIALPVYNWPVLDNFVPTAQYQPGKIDCLIGDPAPFLPLVAAPTAALFNIGQDMQYAISQSQTVCSLPSPIPGDLTGAKMVAQGREAPGHRFMLGIVSLGDARREGLQLASLQTQSSVDPYARFTDASGQTFVSPTDQSLKSAAATLTPDEPTHSWKLSYDGLRASTPNAYPGTMVVYAEVPTTGLPPADAKDYATLINYMAGPGQVSGTDQGELADGYLPMTAGNGLAALAQYAGRAAQAVAGQSATVPPLTPAAPTPTPSPTATPTPQASHTATSAPPVTTTPQAQQPTTAGDLGTQPVTDGGAPAVPSSEPSKAPTSTAPATPKAVPATINATPAALTTPRYQGGFAGVLFPVLALLMIAAGLAAAAMRIARRLR